MELEGTSNEKLPLRQGEGAKAARHCICATKPVATELDRRHFPRMNSESSAMAARDALTKNQLCVLERLESATGPLSAYTLLDQLREKGFRAPLQVYRALDSLIKGGFVHRLESLNAFVACSEPHDHDHGMAAFAICDRCGQVAELSDHAIEHQLDAWVRSTGFASKKAVLEFRGTCGKCVAQA